MSTGTGQVETISLAEAVPLMQPADWLFYDGAGWKTYGIRLTSLSRYSHVGMLDFKVSKKSGMPYPVLLDTVQWRGGGAVSLKNAVKRHPGKWHWFKTNHREQWPEFDRDKAVERMWEFTDIEYGWSSLGRASLVYLPGIRLFQKIDYFAIDDAATYTTPPFCSMAVAIATEYGGVDPVPRLRHSLTSPGILSQSMFADRVGALVP